MQKRHAEDDIIGIVELSNGCWYVTFNQHVLGDSRGFASEHQAEAEARKIVSADPDYRQLNI